MTSSEFRATLERLVKELDMAKDVHAGAIARINQPDNEPLAVLKNFYAAMMVCDKRQDECEQRLRAATRAAEWLAAQTSLYAPFMFDDRPAEAGSGSHFIHTNDVFHFPETEHFEGNARVYHASVQRTFVCKVAGGLWIAMEIRHSCDSPTLLKLGYVPADQGVSPEVFARMQFLALTTEVDLASTPVTLVRVCLLDVQTATQMCLLVDLAMTALRAYVTSEEALPCTLEHESALWSPFVATHQTFLMLQPSSSVESINMFVGSVRVWLSAHEAQWLRTYLVDLALSLVPTAPYPPLPGLPKSKFVSKDDVCGRAAFQARLDQFAQALQAAPLQSSAL